MVEEEGCSRMPTCVIWPIFSLVVKLASRCITLSSNLGASSRRKKKEIKKKKKEKMESNPSLSFLHSRGSFSKKFKEAIIITGRGAVRQAEESHNEPHNHQGTDTFSSFHHHHLWLFHDPLSVRSTNQRVQLIKDRSPLQHTSERKGKEGRRKK